MPLAPLLLPVLAQEAADPSVPAEDPAGAMMRFLLPIGIIFVVFWFVLLRPQQKQDKQRRSMLDALKKRDRVLTSGGILGTVADIRDDEVTLKVSENPDVKLRVRRSAVVEVMKESADQAGP
jgi:preprotein translocase subunit YajC